jgi:photosystem II stability/assembly factor-like uncharacterized protein
MSRALLAGLMSFSALSAQSLDPAMFQDLHWRAIGPFRGGRTVAATGVPGKPHLFYMAANHGGVWKTTDAGRTWAPIFDDQPTGSIGALAVAPSNSDVIYVGSSEGLQRPDLSVGDGIYKSTDGGKSWVHLGLRDAQQIPAIVVDPKNPDRLFVAALGHPYGANAERGVYRSLDGGRTFERVLFKGEDTGAVEVALDPGNPQIVYAALWSARQAPWENGAFRGAESGLYKSTDGGTTWAPLTKGLPGAAQGLSRIGFAIAPSRPQRLYAQVDSKQDAGTYRSDDGGQSWEKVNAETRVSGRGDDFAEIRVHPKDPDTVFAANTSTYRSTDGGRTWTAIKGAPGGDDYHRIWLNPEHPEIMLLGSDQGATISLNGGETWSSWYNQPTAQFYHVITDDQFPYWVYGGQQESGSVGILSRGPHGAISFRDWLPVGVEEYGYVAPDPLNPHLIYGGKVSRFDRRTGQTQEVGPDPLRLRGHRFLRTAPLLFSPAEPHTLFFAGEVVFRTRDGGAHWDVISPDLSRTELPTPPNVGAFSSAPEAKIKRRGVVYALAPGAKDVNLLWAGTDDGLIHLTRDGGKQWTDVTPKGLGSWSKIAQLEASRFDPAVCYAAVNALRLDDLRPHIFRTRDFGRTWQEITQGLPMGAVVNAVREDSTRRGLLFAATERQVYASFDQGEHWQSLRLNMPSTSIRDLVVHGDDVVVGTHGRGFWILDNMNLLRQAEPGTAPAEARLYMPQRALRWRSNLNPDTPLPPEEPVSDNPPEGALIDYWLPASAKSVAIEMLNAEGVVVRRFSEAMPAPVDPSALNVPSHWIRREKGLATTRGHHRMVWDLRVTSPPSEEQEPPIAARTGETVLEPRGPWVMPGRYRVRLTVDGRSSEQPLEVVMDPRVNASTEALKLQFQLAMRLAEGMAQCRIAASRAIKSGDQGRAKGLLELNGRLGGLLVALEAADQAPTPAQAEDAAQLLAGLEALQRAAAKP